MIFFFALSGRESSLVRTFCESCEQLDITHSFVHAHDLEFCDYFSKWPEAAPLPDKTAAGVGLFFMSCFAGWFPTFAHDLESLHQIWLL